MHWPQWFQVIKKVLELKASGVTAYLWGKPPSLTPEPFVSLFSGSVGLGR